MQSAYSTALTNSGEMKYVCMCVQLDRQANRQTDQRVEGGYLFSIFIYFLKS